MTLGTLLLYIGIAAVVFFLAARFLTDRIKNPLISFLQFYCGSLFVFSGWVKAIDPLGTAFKMEQYFGQFYTTFQSTAISFIAPVFPWLSEYGSGFAVAIIVFEMVLGIMLLLGFFRRFTTWAFFALVLFFTALTGFTYLTGFVPEGVNFFQFGQWGKFVETNMKVTDCGCFGDFLKLKPKVSFLKDVFLLVPAVIFLWKHRQMHQLMQPSSRIGIVALSIPALVLYCLSNFVWDEPHTDFRPFKVGVNIGEQKAVEQEAQANVKIVAYRLTNKKSKEMLEVPFEQFLKEMSKYPSEEWEMEQVKSEPSIAPSKISEFSASDLQGNEVTDQLLTIPGYSFLIVAYHLEGKSSQETVTVPDTTFRMDTVGTGDALQINKVVDKIADKQVTRNVYDWQKAYLSRWSDLLNPAMDDALKAGAKVNALVAYGSADMIQDFQKASGSSAYPFYTADDILLKTIIRSNPGVLLMKDGTILAKWHIQKLPDFETIKGQYWKE